MPKLSIIVPVYNKANYVEECIESILAQTMEDFELILVNDGSSDKSGEKCDHFARLDKRVMVIHQVNQGVSAARNTGLDRCTGDYIGFVDSDDILDPDMYEFLIGNAEKNNADISICGVRRVSPKQVQLFGGKGEVRLYNTDEGLTALFYGKIVLSNYDKVYKFNTVKDIRFPPALYEDTFYNFEALRAAKATIYDDAVKYNYMIRENSHSMAPFNQKFMNTLVITKQMTSICSNELPAHLDEARTFDFRTNIMILNMILASPDDHTRDFEIVRNTLMGYSKVVNRLKNIGIKYRYSYYVFLFSPALYAFGLKVYAFVTNSEHLNRKQKSSK